MTVLFAARLPAWVIALSVYLADTRPVENLRYEPTLLIVTLALVLVTVSYAPLLRRIVRARLHLAPEGRGDLFALVALDLTLVFGVLLLSGGFNTPYYHFAIVALLVPAFLLGWAGSLATLVVFIGALIATWSVSGGGTDLWLRREQFGGPIPGLLVTPVLVVVVAQYLAWVVRRLEEEYERTRRALDETTAMYGVARAVGVSEDPAQLGRDAVAEIGTTALFPHVSAWLRDGEELRLVASAGRPLARADFALRGELLPDSHAPLRRLRLHRAGGNQAPPNIDLLAVPLYTERELAGALAVDASPLTVNQTLLLRAVGEQLSHGFARIALADERARLVAAEERARIARDIHDGVAQSLYMLTLHLDKTASLVEGDPVLGERIRLLLWLAREALVEVRQYVFDLEPLLAGRTSLVQTVREQASEFAKIGEISIVVESEGEEKVLPLSVRGALYRVVQEALANACRHAEASRITVRVAYRDQELALEISDDGVGFDAAGASGAGHGLRNMSERLGEVGGELRVESVPGDGTTILARLPLSEVSPAAR